MASKKWCASKWSLKTSADVDEPYRPIANNDLWDRARESAIRDRETRYMTVEDTLSHDMRQKERIENERARARQERSKLK